MVLLILDLNKTNLEGESRVQMSGGRCICAPNGRRPRLQIRCLLGGGGDVQCAPQPRNCCIISWDDPVQLNRKSVPRLRDGDSGRVEGLLKTVFYFYF